MGIAARGYEFVEDVAPKASDITIPKHHASAFFGTPLASHLVNLRVDSVYIAGCTTSGCVRASAVDATSLGFRVTVPHECVFDRSQTSHAVNLFDMASKYADVLSLQEAIDRLPARVAARVAS
jgi:nicotinamidase-related amidase